MTELFTALRRIFLRWTTMNKQQIDDLDARVRALEKQVAELKAALEALQKPKTRDGGGPVPVK